MLFNSYTFIVFFALVLVVSRLRLPWPVSKTFLLVASYVFYAAWNPPFVLLLWLSTLIDWFVAKRLGAESVALRRRLLLAASLASNLGLLAFFKYGGFLLENFVAIAGALGWDFHPARPDIILPVGISFYTFQTLSYTFDVYRRQARPWHSFLDYALYVTFFPQLVAGPIVRAVDFLPQCAERKRASARQLGWGLSLMVVGLFEKIVIADRLMSPIVERVFDASALPDTITAWIGTVGFAFQIFCDFAGYSTCAIGVALCLGFALPDNFRFPYAAVGFSDFWRRWHISLSTWLRDYLYIPLGGNRKGSLRTYANLMATMLLGGLWHGASWTFVVWGGLHGIYLAVERLLHAVVPPSDFWRRSPVKIALGAFTFALVCLTWVFFRAGTFHRAHVIVLAMLGLGGGEAPLWVERKTVLLVAAGMLPLHWWMRDTSLEELADRCPWWVRSALLALMLTMIVLSMTGRDSAFIYFQF